jgi:glycosyltransferase involved in cell wall biosynthesis
VAPAVSVVMPVLNEARHLAEAVGAVLSQSYDGPLEVVLAIGPSTDGTDALAKQLAEDPRVRTVVNPSGRTPDALNAAIADCSVESEFIIRVDGHALLPPNYVATAIRVLQDTGADNTGGVMAAEGTTPFESAVACAMRSPVGVGSAAFHTGGQAGPAATVYLGAFRRSALERVGGYDPRFTRTQDWEMNHRIRATGGLVWFTPELEVAYRPRASVRALARQYFQYGYWRRLVMRTHQGTASIRYLAAPAMVVVCLAGTVMAWIRPEIVLVPLAYVVGATVAGLWIGAGRGLATMVRVPIALMTMHWSWGIGFLSSWRALRPR